MEVREPNSRYLADANTHQTEVGQLPADWSAVALADLLTSKQLGGNYKNGATETSSPLIKMGNLGRGRIDLGKIDYIHPSTRPSTRDRLKAGDVLFNTRNTLDLVGKVALWRDELPEAYFNSNIMRMCFDPTRIGSNAFMNYVLNTSRSVSALRAIATGTTSVAAIYSRDFTNVFLPLPCSRTEQRAIAEALTDADALIDSLEQLLTKKRQIKQGAMQELLTGKRRLPGFEGAWTDGVLGDVVAELVAGVSVNSDPTESGAGVPSVVKTSALKGGVFDPSERKPIIQADLARATTPLRHDTLLISRMNTPDLVGEVGYVDRAYDWLYLPDRIWMTRMRSSDCVCVRWLGYLLSSAPYKRLIGDTATGTSGSMKNIAKSALLGLPLRFPDVDEQRAIAEGLADMDAEITALAARLTKARALKQAMAQALLTGRIRIPLSPLEPTA